MGYYLIRTLNMRLRIQIEKVGFFIRTGAGYGEATPGMGMPGLHIEGISTWGSGA
jgi:hypothetical protein